MRMTKSRSVQTGEGRAIMRASRWVMAALALLLPVGSALAQATYSDKPVRIVVGFTARLFAQKFSEAWNVPVTVENIPGSGGGVAADRVARSAPDGTTLMWGANGALTINPSLQTRSGYDSVADLAAISLVLRMPSIIAVNNDLPAKTIQDLLGMAKARPGRLSYATPGVGTPQHIGGELLKMLAGIDIIHVPYRGAVFTDVIGGRVDIAWQNSGSMLPIVREGKLRGLAVTSLERSPNIPELPTLAESGFPGFEATSWFALVAPAGTPEPIVAKVHRETLNVLKDPDMREACPARPRSG